MEPGHMAPLSVSGLNTTASLIKPLALMGRLSHEVCDGCEDIIKLCAWSRHLDGDLCVFICTSRGLGCSSACPVHTPPGGPLQHLQAQTGRAPQRRLQPGLACHEQAELNSGGLHLLFQSTANFTENTGNVTPFQRTTSRSANFNYPVSRAVNVCPIEIIYVISAGRGWLRSKKTHTKRP